jgi:glutathione-regulated potassium-efflux system protein KefB
MGKAALRASGIAPDEIERVEREYRLRDCERLERQGETGDLHAGEDRSFAAGPLPDPEPPTKA